jgi:hypothetical protein
MLIDAARERSGEDVQGQMLYVLVLHAIADWTARAWVIVATQRTKAQKVTVSTTA